MHSQTSQIACLQSTLFAKNIDLIAQAQLYQSFLRYQERYINNSPFPDKIIYLTSTQSTNNDALSLSKDQDISAAIIVSHQQSHGRGQQHRTWHSEQGNLFLSILLPLECRLDGRFALECGLQLFDMPSLERLKHQKHIQLKWANDLYSPLGKWGGMLIEPLAFNQQLGTQPIIIGIGMNRFAIQHHQDIQQSVTSLAELGLSINNLNDFIVEIYQAIMLAKINFEQDSPNLAQRFNKIAAFLGEQVQVQRQTQHIVGQFLGIDDTGAMRIKTSEQDVIRCYDGRLSLVND
ncbi:MULTISPECIES: biotin--[acetyl-CoA-carboxylase] ligase [unclassified Acinetobacter]|uniref:biotin--[acetyl-CoA-carboxylase] ligase n=1 Tax=unclassified Acinetobacter TaxID=196816 RepID=UPI0035B7666D